MNASFRVSETGKQNIFSQLPRKPEKFVQLPFFKPSKRATYPFVPKGARSMTHKEIRLASGLSIERAAVAAGVTSPTIRLFEAAPDASPKARAKLEIFYASLQVRLASGANTSPTAAA